MNAAVRLVVPLQTLPGQLLDGSAAHYRLTELTDGTTHLRTPLALHTFDSWDRALFTLGGIISWERLTPESQARLTDVQPERRTL